MFSSEKNTSLSISVRDWARLPCGEALHSQVFAASLCREALRSLPSAFTQLDFLVLATAIARASNEAMKFSNLSSRAGSR